MRGNKRYYRKWHVDSAAIKWERVVQMDRWLFAGAADSDLGLTGLSHLFVLRCSVLKGSRGAGSVSASLSLSSSPRNHWPVFLPGSPGYESIDPFLIRIPWKLPETQLSPVGGLGSIMLGVKKG